MKKLTIALLLLVRMTQAQPNISKIEYWFDSDPGIDNATVATGFTAQPDVHFSFTVPANLTLGIHLLGIRSKDANGVWSHTNFYPVNIADTSTGKIVRVEYFWDSDPGPGSGNDSLLAVAAPDITNGLFTDSVPLSFLVGDTTHILFERSEDSRGRWSHTNYVDSTHVTGTVSVNELATLTGISVYPNPFSENFTVAPQQNQEVRLFLYDVHGKKIIDKLITRQTPVDMQKFSSGAYTLFVRTADNKIFRTTLIKQ